MTFSPLLRSTIYGFFDEVYDRIVFEEDHVVHGNWL